MPESAAVADLVAAFAGWLGHWEGEGRGLWEATPPFRYRESLTIEAVPNRALLRLAQRTTVWASGELSHSEVGFLRLLPQGLVELVVAVPAGYVEIHTGRLESGGLNLIPRALAATPSARALRRVERTLTLDGDLLRNAVAIGVGDEEVAPHVESQLRRALPSR